MGACLSRSAPARAHSAPAQEPDAGVGRQLYEQVAAPASGLHVAVSSARCGSGASGGGDAVLVKTTPSHVFVALFEGLGEQGAAVAAFCRGAAWSAYQECAARHPGEPLQQLSATLERLDSAIFATDRLKHAAKARSGASAVLLLLDPQGGRAYCANVGAAACLLARITGSFQAKAPEGFFLSAEHTTRSREEVVRLHKRAPGEATPPRAAAVGAAGGTGALVCEAHGTDHALTPTDQQLVLGTAAFWRLVGPADCALRAHFHEKFAQRELDRAAAEAAAAGAAEAPSPSLQRAANPAEHLVYWALEKASRRLGRLQQERAGTGSGSVVAGRRLPPSVADLLALPLVAPPAPLAPPTPAAAPGGDAQQQEEQPEQGPAETPLIRSDVLDGDLGVVVLTLRRPTQSMDAGMLEVLTAVRARAGGAAAGAAAAAAGGGGACYVERLSQRRWSQMRMLVDFSKAHRRVLLRQWWDAQEALWRRGRIAGAGAGRIALMASSGGTPSPNKLPSLAAAAAARRAGRVATSVGCEDQGGAANRTPPRAAAAGPQAPKGSPARASLKPSSGARTGSPATKVARTGSRAGSSSAAIKAVRPGGQQ